MRVGPENWGHRFDPENCEASTAKKKKSVVEQREILLKV